VHWNVNWILDFNLTKAPLWCMIQLENLDVMEETMLEATIGPEFVDESTDLKSKLGLSEDESAEVLIYRKDPRKRFSLGEYVGRIPINDFEGPHSIAHYGPGEYVLKVYKDGRYVKGGYAEVSISEEAARSAGWEPPAQSSQNQTAGQSTTQVPFIPEQLMEEFRALREDLRQERASKENIIAEVLRGITSVKESRESNSNPVIEAVLVHMNNAIQQSAQQTQNMLVQIQQSFQASQQTMMEILRASQENTMRMITEIASAIRESSKKETSIQDVVAAIAPFVNKSSPEAYVNALVQMFQSGINTALSAAELKSPSEGGWMGILQSIAPTVAPIILQQVLSKQGGTPAPPPVPQPDEHPAVQGPTNEPKAVNPAPEKPELPNQQAHQNQQQQRVPAQIQIASLLDRIARKDPSAVKEVFMNNLRIVASMTMDRDTMYEFMTAMLPAAVHELIPEMTGRVQFSVDDGVDPSIAEYVWNRIAEEYKEEEEE
jgi:hypothetical protein